MCKIYKVNIHKLEFSLNTFALQNATNYIVQYKK